jgi:hypothetical protein
MSALVPYAGLQLPYGLQPVNPAPVDAWSGPYVGATLTAARSAALEAIPLGVRFQSMEVRLIVGGVSKKYWFRDGTADSNLVEFSSGNQAGGGGEIDLSGYALLSGATFSGPIVASAGLSGSLTTLTDGATPYLTGGTGVSVTTGSNGQVQVSLSGGARSGTVTDLVLNAELSGTRDGTNTVFTLPDSSIDPGTLMLWLNGQLLTLGSDFTLAGNTVTFVNEVAPVTTDVLRAMYSRQVSTKLFALAVEPTAITVVNNELTGLTLPQHPDPATSLMLFLNGQLLTQGQDHDYSLTGGIVTFARGLMASDVIRATYSYVA